MKSYSIGREQGCDIVINDSTDVISRRHAVLTVGPGSKMTILDQSQNGTYINGIRISRNVPVPVTRKDNVSFAHVAQLDWNIIPNPIGYLKYVIAAVAAIVVIGGGIWAYIALSSDPTPAPPADNGAPNTVVAPSDTLNKNAVEPKEETQNPENDKAAKKDDAQANEAAKTKAGKSDKAAKKEEPKPAEQEEAPKKDSTSNASKYRL